MKNKHSFCSGGANLPNIPRCNPIPLQLIEEKDVTWGFWQKCYVVVKPLFVIEFKDGVNEDFTHFCVDVNVYQNNNGKRGKIVTAHHFSTPMKYLRDNNHNKKSLLAELANKSMRE